MQKNALFSSLYIYIYIFFYFIFFLYFHTGGIILPDLPCFEPKSCFIFGFLSVFVLFFLGPKDHQLEFGHSCAATSSSEKKHRQSPTG